MRKAVVGMVDSCIVGLVSWCASVKQRAAENAQPAQPAAVEIQQAPTFNVVEGQAVQPMAQPPVVDAAAVSVQVDTNNDGVADSLGLDTNNDGVVDTVVPMGLAVGSSAPMGIAPKE